MGILERLSEWWNYDTGRTMEMCQAEIARLQAEVERLRNPDWIRFNDAAVEAFSMILDFPHGDVELSEGDGPEDFRDNFITVVRSIRNSARNDALEEAARLAETSINDGGLAKSMAHFIDAEHWRVYKESCLKYAAAIRALKRQ